MGAMWLLEKWQCHKCEKGFLLIDEDAKGRNVHCPFCGQAGNHVESVAGQNPDFDYREEMGCLWPGYNELDKVCYQMSRGQISKEQANEYIQAILRGQKTDLPV
ncbi:hypothetical protein POF51_22570 [Brevibacillus sp. AG]|uniref:hypothetical protein n=1 Tax=Brevibacillus sp. AG TaxID=3020891 RepID=UPI00232A906F|nr:hypothetical protein [Brevibacillus sp. AG]MDC0763514.1 hypothetical protein [Brevibacillus sp. AG]